MLFNVKGVNQKSGEYQGHNFDNCYLFGTDEGGNWDMIKVPTSVITSLGMKEPTAIVGNSFQLYYNKYGKVDLMKVHNK